MLDDFKLKSCQLQSGVEIVYRLGGAGPPLLLLHGYPQTHLMWAKVAPELAQSFTLWGDRGVLEVWRRVSKAEVSGAALPRGHFLAEEAAIETRDRLHAFFA